MTITGKMESEKQSIIPMEPDADTLSLAGKLPRTLRRQRKGWKAVHVFERILMYVSFTVVVCTVIYCNQLRIELNDMNWRINEISTRLEKCEDVSLAMTSQLEKDADVSFEEIVRIAEVDESEDDEDSEDEEPSSGYEEIDSDEDGAWQVVSDDEDRGRARRSAGQEPEEETPNKRRHKKTKKTKKTKRGGSRNRSKVSFSVKNNQLQISPNTSKAAFDAYLQEHVARHSIAAIHMEANISEKDANMTYLSKSDNHNITVPGKHGVMFYQGFKPDNETLAFWTPAEWAKDNPQVSAVFDVDTDRGSITVKKAGLYFIYAQVHFHETRLEFGYHVKVERLGRVFSCFSGVDHVEEDDASTTTKLYDLARYKSCTTSGVLHLQKDDLLTIISFDKNSKISFLRQTSYWGLVQVSDSSETPPSAE